MATKKTPKSAAKSAGRNAAKTTAASSRLAAVGRTNALPRKTASAKTASTTVTKISTQATLKGQLPAARNGRVTTPQPTARVSAQALPSAPLMPVKPSGLDKAIKDLEKVVSKATNLPAGKEQPKIRIDSAALLAIKRVISVLRSTRDSIVNEAKPDTALTSQEVADMLNVSRPYVVKLAREGQLSHAMVGNRHRFLLSAVQEYEGLRRVERDVALAAIVPESGYTAEDF